MENSNFILGSRQYAFADSIDEVTVFFAEPLYHGQPVGLCFFFPKRSLRDSFCSRFPSSHTLNFWKKVFSFNKPLVFSLSFVMSVLKKMSYEERVIYQES